jgi:hypothetical protein
MPAHDRLRLHDQQDARPFRPPAQEGQPEQAIPPAQLGSTVLASENGELMTQGGELKSEISPRAKEGHPPPEESHEDSGHPTSLHDRFHEAQVTDCTRRSDLDDPHPSLGLVELPVRLPDGRVVRALTPVNDRTRTTYIGNVDIGLRPDMARLARGTDGACVDYVRNIHVKLTSLGIVDTDVETFVALTGQAPVT